jgi:hypothetical protein
MIKLTGGYFGDWSYEPGDVVATDGPEVTPAEQIGDELFVTDNQSTVWIYRLPDGAFVGVA